MADNLDDDASARAEDRFKGTLPRSGYWSVSRFAVAGLAIAAILLAALELLG